MEIYLKLTPRESERLRVVSALRQRERGYKVPGSAGLVVERWGDAEPWVWKGGREGSGRSSEEVVVVEGKGGGV